MICISFLLIMQKIKNVYTFLSPTRYVHTSKCKYIAFNLPISYSFAVQYFFSAVFTWTNLLVVVAELDGGENEALDLVPLVTNIVLEVPSHKINL